MEMVGNALKLFDRTKLNIKDNDRNEQFCAQVSEYKFNMFRLAKSILHHDTDAEDAVSEAILKAYANLPALRKMESFKGWIMKILVNESYKISNQRKKVYYLDQIEMPDEVKTPDHKELWQVVEGLEEEFRIVTILFYYEDMTIKEISKILDLPIGTVKSRLNRARGKLKEILTEEGSL